MSGLVVRRVGKTAHLCVGHFRFIRSVPLGSLFFFFNKKKVEISQLLHLTNFDRIEFALTSCTESVVCVATLQAGETAIFVFDEFPLLTKMLCKVKSLS